jgi:hypothetical protein
MQAAGIKPDLARVAERTIIDAANEEPVAGAAAVRLVGAPGGGVMEGPALVVPAGWAWLAVARDAERGVGCALEITTAAVDRDAEAAAVALAGWAPDALPALRAAAPPLLTVGVRATLTSRKAGVPTRTGGVWRTAAEEAAPKTAAVAEPVAAPGTGLVG